ncbi:hypothetical protein HY477_03950 [Candidatus Uhrbacteria bacterium]|nr:hypothetical protein [Candidatus Uhrbacteria bacterium]
MTPGSGEYPPAEIPTAPRYAENIFESLPAMEIGTAMQRAAATRLSTGKDTKLKLSATEAVERQGWSADAVLRARKGDALINRSGQVFEVVSGDKKRLQIRDAESGEGGAIVFEPRAIQAQAYTYQLSGGGKTKKLRVYDSVYKDRSLDTTDFLDSIMSAVPAQCLDVFDEIRIVRMETTAKGGQFKAEPSLLANTKSITLYVEEGGYPTKETLRTFYHELGHALARYLKGDVHPGAKWKKAMEADKNSVSEYSAKTRYPRKGDQGEIEDFADTVMMYLATDGAKTPATKTLRDFCQNRFQKLDEVFEDLASRQGSGIIGDLTRRLSKPSGPLDK